MMLVERAQIAGRGTVMLDVGELHRQTAEAVRHFWRVRLKQASFQRVRGRADKGERAAVTGGRQMDGFLALLSSIIRRCGVPPEYIHRRRRLELPGFFRAEKKWDVVVIREGRLIAALEAKAQAGPSFGNNLNNRVEEALGSSLDLWTAYREGAFGSGPMPWLGYLFLLEECDSSTTPVRVYEPHFAVLPEFADATYAVRYEVLCRKLVRERHYSAAALLMSRRDRGLEGQYTEPAPDLTFERFCRSLAAQILAFAKG